MKNWIIFSLIVLVLIAVGSADLMAQPPGMPSAPDQAPIDGGLSLLVLGGGAYALKKLRNKK
jgi:hypothetical protein